MNWKKDAINLKTCPICGGRSFLPGPNNRLNNGLPPGCERCNSLERHRIAYNCYRSLPAGLLKKMSCLHFAQDPAIKPEWFGKYEYSVYGGHNSIDLQAIDRPDDSYDWVICNHVLEHVADDAQAMREMLRVIKPSGVLQFAIPVPMHKQITEDWGKPDSSQHFHYRVYGADFLTRFENILHEGNMLSVVGMDPITGDQDVLFFVSEEPSTLATLRNGFLPSESALQKPGGPLLHQVGMSINDQLVASNWSPVNTRAGSFLRRTLRRLSGRSQSKKTPSAKVLPQKKMNPPAPTSSPAIVKRLQKEDGIVKLTAPVMKLSTNDELADWYYKHQDFVKHRERTRNGSSEADFMNADLKLIQDLAMCDFMYKHLYSGAKVLEIGGGVSRILSFFAGDIEGWNLDKFEGAGNGPKHLPKTSSYKIVQNDIGAFDGDLPDSYFDMVFSISVIEHINEGDDVLKGVVDDIDRVLKPGGLNVHCIDCRFPANREPDISNRRMANYMIKHYGFSADTVYENFQKEETFTMSGETYNKFWKRHCKNRPWELDGLPFNIFLASTK